MKNQAKSASELKAEGWQIGAIPGPVFYDGVQHEITPDDITQAAANFHRLTEETGREFVIDYDHSLDRDEPLTSRERAMAAGWIKEVQVTDGNLMIRPEWVDYEADIKSGRFKGLSPVIIKKAKDKKTGKPIGTYMPSVALTNKPHIDELRIAASERPSAAPEAEGRERRDAEHGQVILLFNELEIPAIPTEKEDKMGKEKEEKTEEQTALGKLEGEIGSLKEGIAKIGKALGLNDSSPEKIQSAALALKEKTKSLEKDSDKQLTELRGRLETLEGEKEKHLAFAEQVKKEGRENAVERLVAESKITPADKEFYLQLSEKAPELFAEKVKDLKPMKLSEKVVNVDFEGKNHDLKVPEGGDPESAKLEARAMKLSEKEGITFDKALDRLGGE